MNPLLLIGAALGLSFAAKASTAKAASSEIDPEDEASVSTPTKWTKYDALFQKYAAKYGVDWRWLKAIALNETVLGTNAWYLANDRGSSDGKSWGLMQVTLATGQWLAGFVVEKGYLLDDEKSIDLAAKYVKHLSATFPGEERKIIMSYNQGEGNTQKGKEYAAAYYERWQRWMEKIIAGKVVSL